MVGPLPQVGLSGGSHFPLCLVSVALLCTYLCTHDSLSIGEGGGSLQFLLVQILWDEICMHVLVFLENVGFKPGLIADGKFSEAYSFLFVVPK